VELTARETVRREIVKAFPAWKPRLGPDHLVDLKGFGSISDSALTSTRAIEMTDRGLPSTFVPGRNLTFLIHAAALADRRGVDVLVGGMCETDYSGYPDCRREAMDAMQTALRLGMARPFRIETPLMRLTKAQTWALAQRLGGEALIAITLEDTHTCYKGERTAHDWGRGCGACPACELRAQGFAEWTAAGRPALEAALIPTPEP
jgi:7-cyano-7-deazaguanine synthase